jgi:hypothetical protein
VGVATDTPFTSKVKKKTYPNLTCPDPIYIIKGNVPAEKQSTTFFGEEIF